VIPSEAQGGYAACQITPAFWMNIAGPATNKVSGDRYATKTNCGTGVDLCTSGTNDEYDPDGYVFVVRVQPSAVNQQIDLQLYDPAFIYTNDTCTAAPTRTSFTVNRKALASNVATLTTSAAHGFAVGDVVTVSGVDATITAVTSTTFSFAKTASNVTSVAVSPTGSVTLSMTNPYAPTAADAAARYALDTSTSANAKTFCPGDQMLNSGTYLNTSFVLREQTDSLDPSKAVPIDACTKQYASLRTGAPNDNGNLTGPTAAQLTQGSAKYDASLAQLFHQWVDFCSFIPNRPGDYYLQVRTNVRLVGAKTGNYIYSGISNGNQVANPATLDESGSGHNRFAIRAYVSNTAAASQVSVAGWQQMSIYTNASAASSTFNLVQVLPNSAGNSFNFEAYDNGDATCPNRGDCKLQVSLPFDAYATDGGSLTMGGCVGTGPETTPYTNPCTFNVSGNNGRVQIITVPIPTNYGCDEASPGGCWFRVTASFPSAVSDTVTYGTEIIEDPVRLIQ
jgi:hypothetical protein